MGSAGHQIGLWSMISEAGLMVQFIMLLLLLLSVLSWAIILYKINLLKKMEKETNSFYDLLLKNRDLSQLHSATGNYPFTPLSRLFKEAYAEAGSLAKSGRYQGAEGGYIIERILKKSGNMEKLGMERNINFLATTGNTAPFIGLFGTVWGIMNTFGSIGATGAASIAVVAPGISEALIATAMGLFAAIPAVVGYNHILTRIDRISGEVDSFSTDLTNMLEKKLRGDVVRKKAPEAVLED